MSLYIHGATQAPVITPAAHHEALEEERARLAAEAQVYGELYRQQQHLDALRKAVHRKLGPPPEAETIRQAAIIRNNDSPETCARRLEEAASEAARWIDPRRKKIAA